MQSTTEEEVCSSLTCGHKFRRGDYGRKSALKTEVVWLPFHMWSKDARWSLPPIYWSSLVPVARYSDTGPLPKTQWRFLAPQIYLSAEALGFWWVVHAVIGNDLWDLQSPGCSWGRSHRIEDVRCLKTFKFCGRQSGSLNAIWDDLVWKGGGDQQPPRDKPPKISPTQNSHSPQFSQSTISSMNFAKSPGCTTQPACHSFYCLHTSSRRVSTGACPISKPCAYRGIFAELHQQGLWIRYPASQLSNFCLLAEKLFLWSDLLNCTSEVQHKYPCWTDNSFKLFRQKVFGSCRFLRQNCMNTKRICGFRTSFFLRCVGLCVFF